ncbi:TetR/AcrR family transcriptional regulator [Pseudooceanicola nitratireducens]|uniref:TetR/AcrR family transcriptional regulator n=1 Tax=Pseudooceanicola nitratireducens TaxID=517719 RepID=UPI001C96A991|nr:TetR/AcrR family transcriptional regulator [Pseudooceanicola nitratireducens]MBY6157589.1 TetR/AcrR family transcriptional regulator [Pseudooceanicola nitratireducens]
MKQDRRARRADEIEAAAYAVLEEKGYAGLTMLAVAKAAKASNETLYRWYGDKTGLFRALILGNVTAVQATLDQAQGQSPMTTLRAFGPALLAMLLGPRAVALNRAAAADPTGDLGRTLAESGRDTVGPWLGRVIARGIEDGSLPRADVSEMIETYFALLIGDTQIRRVTGAMEEPDADWIADRADQALTRTIALFQAAQANSDLDSAGHRP